MLKKKCISISVFDYKNKENFLIYISKKCFKRQVDLLLIEKIKTVKFYNYMRKTKLKFMHYANFKIILVLENYGSLDYSYVHKYLNHVFWVQFWL